MANYIDKQAAIDALKEHRALYCDNTPDAFSKLSHAEKSRVDELDTAIATLVNLPPAEPKRETATVSVGISKGGVTMWYECAVCGEPVDQGDTFCSGCGRRLIHG